MSGSYTFITEPIEAIVVRGILNAGSSSAELEALNDIVSMSFTTLKIPEGVESIGPYFLYNSRKTFDLEIGPDVKSIDSYAFYDAIIHHLTFAEDYLLSTLFDNAFYHLEIGSDIVLPKSITSWGKYIFQNSAGGYALKFEKDSLLESLGSYALWENMFSEIELPDGLQTLSGNTYVIKNCTNLKKLWIPNSLTSVVPANAIYGCFNLTEIILEKDFNISANFSNCTELSETAMVNMLYSLKNLNGSTAKSLTLGAKNLAKLTETEKAIATNKNWTLS